MRVVRSLMVMLVAAIAAAGCARQPVGQVAVAARPAPVAGIDNMVYGGQVPAPVPVPTPAPIAAGRGLPAGFMTSFAPRIVATPVAARPVMAAPIAAGQVVMPPVVATPVMAGPMVAGGMAAAPMMAAPMAYAPGIAQGPYTLDSGDRLRVVVFGQDGLSNSYAVDASGHIAMPLIGSVSARGATTDELSNRIAERLRQGFIREPHVAVEIEAYRPFFILGEVTAPGQYPYVANMTVETAVAIAGGFGPRGFRKQVTISRNIRGQVIRFEAPVTYPVCPGDTVIIQERWF